MGVVLDRCDRASLAAFGRALLERWIAARRPSDGGWVLDQFSRTADDDADLAPAAYRQFAMLVKELRDEASRRLRRLEQSMVTGRRWSADEFRRYFVEHPLLWHAARRLVWTAGGAAFRLAEDRTPVDADGAAMPLPKTAAIGIAHPAELGDAVTAWAQVFADHGIVQPFAQLGRDVGVLTDAECAAGRLDRCTGVAVRAGAVLALSVEGWEQGPVREDGFVYSMIRHLPGDLPDLVIEFTPALPGNDATGSDSELTLREVRFTRPSGDELDSATTSELLVRLFRLG